MPDIPVPARSRRRRMTVACVVLAVVGVMAPLVGIATAGDDGPADPVARPLGIGSAVPTMRPVPVPARFRKVAAVPDSPDDEAWAVALADRFDGADGKAITVRDGPGISRDRGSELFFRYTRRFGWEFAGIPRDESGNSLANLGLSNRFRQLVLTPSGVGSAVRAGADGDQFYRRDRNGGDWILDSASTEALNADGSREVRSLALGEDASGVYGIAVVSGPNRALRDDKILRYDGRSWSFEVAIPPGSAPAPTPTATPTPTASPTPTPTAAASPTSTPSPIPTPTSSLSPSPAPTDSASPTASATPSPSASPSPASSASSTPGPVPSLGPSPLPTVVPSPPASPGYAYLSAVTLVSRDEAWATGPSREAAGVHPLLVHRVGPGRWERVPVGKPFFDDGIPREPEKNVSETFKIENPNPPMSISTDGRDVWFVGQLSQVDRTYRPLTGAESLPYPLSTATTADGQFSSSDGGPMQSFAVRYRPGEPTRTYCPIVARVSAQGEAKPVRLCDHELPPRAFLTKVKAFSGGVVAVGQFGVLSYDEAAGWRRQPTAVLRANDADFTSPREGWVTAITGENIDPANVVGHWTDDLTPDTMRRWPTPATVPLEAVAAAPDGSGAAVAVGGRGTIALLEPGIGWDLVSAGTTAALHGVAWESGTRAWAVGDSGTVVRIDRSPVKATVVPVPGQTALLTAVAFDRASNGWAVGAGGAVLRYGDGTWTAESRATTALLNAVAIAGDQVLAVGNDAVLVVRQGGVWQVQDPRPSMLYDAGEQEKAANLLAVAGLPDGRAVIGGSTGVLLLRTPDGQLTSAGLPPLDGQITYLAAAPGGGAPRLLAVVAERGCRVGGCAGNGLPGQYGQLFSLRGGQWRPLGAGRVPAIGVNGPPIEAPVLRDPVRAVAFDPASGFQRGWAVGGLSGAPHRIETPPGELSWVDGHSDLNASTSSVWRLDSGASPAPEPAPGETTLPRLAPEGTVGFAFLGDSACGIGLCSLVEGAGSRADVMLSAALYDVARAHQEGTVGFVTQAGNLRGTGVPIELEQASRAFAGLDAPWFAALGAREVVVQGLAVNGTNVSVDIAATIDYALATFNAQPPPWGHRGAAPKGIEPVKPLDGLDRVDRARTHYAFDYAPKGQPLLRVIVFDTSRAVTNEPGGQNPTEPQLSWLAKTLADACQLPGDPSACWPSVVVMNRPLHSAVADAADANEATAMSAVLANATALLAGRQWRNRTVPGVSQVSPRIVVSGTLGSRLEPDVAERGGYPAWQLVTLDPGATTALGRAGLVIRSIPILESLALSGPDGRTKAAGGTLRFAAVGRIPDAGSGIPETRRTYATGQGRTAGSHLPVGSTVYNGAGGPPYLRFPFPTTLCLPGQDPVVDQCLDPADTAVPAARPDYRFRCLDTRICEFVEPDPLDPTRKTPRRDPLTGKTIPDDQSGLMCAREPGTTVVEIDSGYRAARVPITITARPPGDSPCLPSEEPPPPSAEPTEEPPTPQPTGQPPPPPEPQPEPAPEPEPVPPPAPEPAGEPALEPAPQPVPAPLPEIAPAIDPIPIPVPAPVLLPAPAPAPAPIPAAAPPVVPQAVPGQAITLNPPIVTVNVPPVNPVPAPPGGATVPVAAYRKEEASEAAIADAQLMVAYESPRGPTDLAWPAALTWLAASGFGVAAGAGARRRQATWRPAVSRGDR